ncbi:MAG: GAF domain-containing protein [Actinomycetota bacterium]
MRDLLRDVEDLCSGESSENRLYERAVDCIYEAAEHYDWVGIYRVEGDDLVLTGWRGPQPTEHSRIPLTQGVCGFAASEGKTVVVDDVNADPRYLACFPNTKSEIVVPISTGGEVVAEIDIDSDRPAAFGDGDRNILEQVAGRLGSKVAELRA